ncbi:MAG: inositol monophosphatase [Pirellulales bacterium]|nr:inositol monophosphatase [Pirellulales bacterium]
MNSNRTLEEYLKICDAAVRAGGAAVQSWVGKFEVRKKGPADLVTQADVASQEAVREIVLSAFPDHAFLGEEDDRGDLRENRAEFRWIVDPLDGTTNFVHGLPHYCVSLALERRGEPLVGAVYNPVSGECFAAAAGKGAWLNGKPMRTSRITDLSDALAIMGFPPQVKPDSPDLLVFQKAVFCCQSIRRSGSTALNLSYLAAGRYDVFWGYDAKIWDVAAGVLLVREAGGVLCSARGADFRLSDSPLFAAATPQLLDKILEIAEKAANA